MSRREWAGDKQRQKKIVEVIMRNFAHDDVIDVAGACETILCNLVNDTAPTFEEACKGIDAIADDMKATIREARGN